MDQVRQAADTNRGIWLPNGQRTSRKWPLCLTCLNEVEAVELRDISDKGAELWARCHGKEDYYKVVWYFTKSDAAKDPLDDENVGWAIKRAMHDFSPFNPQHVLDTAKK
jgi:hypothetical protein